MSHARSKLRALQVITHTSPFVTLVGAEERCRKKREAALVLRLCCRPLANASTSTRDPHLLHGITEVMHGHVHTLEDHCMLNPVSVFQPKYP